MTRPRTLGIVVSYNDAANTLACVESLKGQVRTIVWDNASSDDTIERLLASPNKSLTIHRSSTNVLWTPALNRAVAEFYDGEEFLLFSNNDIVYRNDTIDRLEELFEVDPTAGIAAPAGSGLGGLQDFATQHPIPHAQDGHPVMPFDLWVTTRPTLRANYVVGASMMVRYSAWEEIGALDESMPLGADDHDYCMRAKAHRYTIWVVTSAYVEHKGHASLGVARKEWNDWGRRSWEVFNEKWAGYYHNEEEAVKCHWEAKYTPGWNLGTGWLPEADRQAVWDARSQMLV
jgi:hypothetical protein